MGSPAFYLFISTVVLEISFPVVLKISAIFARSIGSARQSHTQSMLLPYRTSTQNNFIQFSSHSFAKKAARQTATNLHTKLVAPVAEVKKKKDPAFAKSFFMAEMVGFPLRDLLQHQLNCVDKRLVSLCCCHSLVLPASSPGRGRTRPHTCRSGTWFQLITAKKKKDPTTAKSFFMAEMVGFEPTCRSSRQHDFQSCSL